MFVAYLFILPKTHSANPKLRGWRYEKNGSINIVKSVSFQYNFAAYFCSEDCLLSVSLLSPASFSLRLTDRHLDVMSDMSKQRLGLAWSEGTKHLCNAFEAATKILM